MAVDKNKIIAEATKLVQRGAFDKAIKTYERILAEDPKDVRIVLKIGELYQKLRDDKAAAEAFKKVAEIYTDQGFFLKAVAVYKQASKLDPDDLRVNEKLAQLNQQLGLMSDAMSQLQLVAAAYEKAGDQARLLDVLKRMVDLDPDNIASSIKLGELHGRANQPDEALEYFQRAADYLKSHSRPDEWVKVAERIAALRPTDAQLARELAHVYLAKGDTKRALAKLQFCFKADPKDVQTLTLLAQAFRDLGQTGKTISVYKELAHVYDEQRKPTEARSIWRKVQELVPDDPDANAAIGGGPAPAPPAAATVAQGRAATAAPPAGPPPGALRPSAAPAAAPPPGALRQPLAPPPAPAAGPGDVVKLLSEVEVYVKYGLHPKALEHLKKIFAIDPENPDALERAREVHFAAGDPDAAAAAGARLVRSLHARGEDARARDELLRVHQIAPGYPEIHELAELVGGDHTDEVSLDSADVEELTLATDAAVEIAGEDDLALALAGAGEGDVVDDENETVEDDHQEADLAAEAAASASDEEEIVEDELPAPVPRRAPPRPAPSPARPALTPPPAVARPALTPPPASARPALTPPPGALRAPAAVARPAAAPPPGPPPGAVRPAPAPTARPPPAPVKPAPAPMAPARAAPAPARPAAPKPAAASRPPARPPPPPPPEEELDLSEDLEEADFFLQQGLLDDAREKLAGLAQFYPDHAGVKAKLAEIERREKGSGGLGEVRATPTLIAPASSDDSFDIARDLADELGGTGDVEAGEASSEDFQFSVEDVFNQFKKGVEQTVGKEDSATHFDLGIAYREMGLLDAAIEEFETAAKGNNRKKEVDCFSMVGLCRVAQGDTKRAIQTFRRALSSEYLTRDAAKALHFEIGTAYESAGNPDGALFFFQKLSRIDPAYRDVSGKVATLGGGPGKAPPEFAAAAARAAGASPRPPGAPGAAARPAPKPGPASAPAKPSGPATTPAPGTKKNIGYL